MRIKTIPKQFVRTDRLEWYKDTRLRELKSIIRKICYIELVYDKDEVLSRTISNKDGNTFKYKEYDVQSYVCVKNWAKPLGYILKYLDRI